MNRCIRGLIAAVVCYMSAGLAYGYTVTRQEEASAVIVKILDTDACYTADDRYGQELDMSVRFTVYGANDTALGSEEVTFFREYSSACYIFGPYPKEQGKKVGDKYWFKVVADISGETSQNLFNISIAPENSESFSDTISFRLLPNQGGKMIFYPDAPSSVSSITVYNCGRATAAGPRRVKYIVTNETQRYEDAAIFVSDASNAVPSSYFTMRTRSVIEKTPYSKCNKFTFDATGSYDPNNEKLSFLWDFGDGETSEEAVIAHVYSKGGQYTVTLTVNDNSGTACSSAVAQRTVSANTPPVADAGPNLVCCTDEESIFDGSGSNDADGDTLTYKWDFGDGSTGEGVRTTHVYKKGGSYRVILYVDDNSGTPCSSAASSFMASVNDRPVAVMKIR